MILKSRHYGGTRGKGNVSIKRDYSEKHKNDCWNPGRFPYCLLFPSNQNMIFYFILEIWDMWESKDIEEGISAE